MHCILLQSDFAKMLNQKRSSRIDAKQKKFLAMMEEETVIDDPKAKAVLVGYKKLEVCWSNVYTKFTDTYCWLANIVVVL